MLTTTSRSLAEAERRSAELEVDEPERARAFEARNQEAIEEQAALGAQLETLQT